MPVAITAFYASILAGLFLVLSFRVISERRGGRFAYGDNDSPRIHAKIRAQANFVEYAPLGLFLLLLLELQGLGWFWLHLLALPFLAGRAIHGYGMSYAPKELKWRQGGMVLTTGAMAVMAVFNLFMALF